MADSIHSGIHHETLMCGAIKLEYDFVRHTGHLWMEDDNCTDMAGAIKIFTAIDSDAVLIITYAGDRKDTLYRKQNGEWNAY